MPYSRRIHALIQTLLVYHLQQITLLQEPWPMILDEKQLDSADPLAFIAAV